VTDAPEQRYYARLEGLVSDRLRKCTALITGAGAGSYFTEKLVRSGVGVRVADFDRVAVENLPRTLYTYSDVGKLKVEALALRLQAVNPWAKAQGFPVDICRLSASEESGLVDGADLIVAGTDHFPAQALANRWSQQYRIPAVFVGVHDRAAGGRIIWSVPGETPCYRCVAHERYEHFERNGQEAVNLPGAGGLLGDVQIIDMTALKVALAILDRGSDTAAGRFFGAMAGRNEIIVRTSPDYEFGNLLWDAVLSDLPATPKRYADELRGVLCAPDTLWLPTAFQPGCPDCGGQPEQA
jgi:molybdopterin/thiamine biosynthesis adenylyltransferase